ncbi:MAG TPA: hypothetical protein VFH43_08410 [Candidatus Kapabacteria bacterium]|nr:hypothetical protein [Candidatus Kapabacteria bacterium]
MNTNKTWIALLFLTVAGVLSSCTATNMTPRISVYRVGDTLEVDLNEETATRWSATRDSLIINCENCETGYTRLVEKFENDNRAAVYISPYERLRLTLFSQDIDTVIIVEPLLSDTMRTQQPRRIVRATPRRRATPPVVKKETPPKKEEVKKEVTKKEEVKKEEKKEEAPKKRATTARVTASEGVAVYKDKSKREVLKILPKGQTMPYIAREGSMISVTVDGQEGFVESEAVRIED